jgi:hypothetical protein
MPGADETGELADDGLAADILREAGGEPEAAESDSAETVESQRPPAKGPKQRPARTSRPAASTDENTEDQDTEQPEGEQPEGDQGEGEQPEGEEPEGEAGEQPEGEQPEGEQPEGEQPEGQTDDDTPEWAKRRFSEYARKVERLEQQLAEARQSSQRPSSAGNQLPADVLTVDTPEQLAEVRAAAERLEGWAELNQAGVEADPENPNSRAYTAQEVAQVRINARRKLKAVEARAQQLEHTQRFNAAAADLYPGFQDQDSEESRALAHVLQQVPELRRLPNYRIIIGDALAGEKARQKQVRDAAAARKSPNGKPLAGHPAANGQPRKAPPVNGAPARGSAAPTGKFALRQKARSQAFKTGSEADIARLVEASFG